MSTVLLAQLEASDWITAGAIALTTILISIIVRRLTKRRIRKKDANAELIDFSGRLIIALVITAGAYYTLQALQVEVGPALGAFGIGALFIAVGLQPLLINVVASVILQARRPFRRGDQILTNNYEGTVLDITTTSTTLLAYNGETIHIPNGQVLGQPLVNWTNEPVRRSVLPISVPYGCELPRVLSQIGRAARNALADDNLPPAEALATGFGDHGINCELRFWHYSDRLESQVALSQIVVGVNQALADADVIIPFPQLVVHPVEPPEQALPANLADPANEPPSS